MHKTMPVTTKSLCFNSTTNFTSGEEERTRKESGRCNSGSMTMRREMASVEKIWSKSNTRTVSLKMEL